MSDQATKSKEIELPKTFETTKSVELTKEEKKALSREKIMAWYESKKFEKLKGLQSTLMMATYSERQEIKKIIIENTKNELAKHEEIIAEERNKRAERFAEEIIGVASGVGNIDIVVSKYNKQQLEEDKFFATLKDYVGKDKDKSLLQKIAASPKFKDLLDELRAENPAKAQEIELMMNEGDFGKARKAISDFSGGKIGEDDVNALCAASVYKMPGFERKTGVGFLDSALVVVNTLRKVGHLSVLNRAKDDLKMEFIEVMNLSTLTLRQIREMDDNLQGNKYLIEAKSGKTPLEEMKLKFIESINSLRLKLDGKAREKGIQDAFERSLDLYLQEKKELTDEDKIKIRSNAKFEDLRLLQIFDLAYGNPEDREKWFIKSMSRIPTIIRAHREIFGENKYIRATYKEYHMKRISEWATNGFMQNARRWNMGSLLKDINDVEKMVGAGSAKQVSGYTDLFERAGKYEISKEAVIDSKKKLTNEMLEHDNLVTRYHSLVQEATKIMTAEAKKVIDAGKSIEIVQRGAGTEFMTKTLDKLPHVSDQTLSAIFGDVSKLDKTKITGGDLIAGYSKKLVDLNGMQEITRARFSALGNVIDTKVAQPFGEVLSLKGERVKGKIEMKNMQKGVDEIRDLVKPTPGKYALKTYGLPGIILGAEMYYLATGKAKTGEVMWDLGEAAAGFMPFLGTSLDIRGAIKGKTLSGKKLSTKERWMYVGFAAIGAVADVATLLGGIGVGLRAGLGGVRAGRRAVQAGKTLDSANTMRQVAYVNDLPWLQRKIASGASYFSKASRAENATEALVAAKAMDQANLIGSLSKSGKYGDLKSLDGVEDALKVANNAEDIEKLKKIQKFYKETSGGVDYMKAMENAGKGINVPASFLGRAWYATLGEFKKVKAYLLSIGIPADVLKTYENSFGLVKGAENLKADSVAKLTKLYEVKHLEQVKQTEALETLAKVSGEHGKIGEQYADLVKQSSELAKKNVSLEQSKIRLTDQYSKLKKSFDATKNMSPDEIAKLSKNITQEELAAAKKLADKADTDWLDSVNTAKKIDTDKATVGNKVASSSETAKTWKQNLDGAGTSLTNTNKEIMMGEEAVRTAEFQLHNANSTRSLIQVEMMQKANDAARLADSFASVTSTLQKGGLVMGGIWFLTGFNKGPAEQYEAMKKYGSKGATVIGDIGHELYVADHSGQPAIDEMVEGRVESVKREKVVMGYLDEAKKKGEDPAFMLARNLGDPVVQEVAKKNGLLEKAQKLLAEGKVKVTEEASAVIKESAAGDVAGKVSEKISG
ncbi:hypothetical protein C0416_01265 [bacterium]|nr:hypothetical protein [bacterium]